MPVCHASACCGDFEAKKRFRRMARSFLLKRRMRRLVGSGRWEKNRIRTDKDHRLPASEIQQCADIPKGLSDAFHFSRYPAMPIKEAAAALRMAAAFSPHKKSLPTHFFILCREALFCSMKGLWHSEIPEWKRSACRWDCQAMKIFLRILS